MLFTPRVKFHRPNRVEQRWNKEVLLFHLRFRGLPPCFSHPWTTSPTPALRGTRDLRGTDFTHTALFGLVGIWGANPAPS